MHDQDNMTEFEDIEEETEEIFKDSEEIDWNPRRFWQNPEDQRGTGDYYETQEIEEEAVEILRKSRPKEEIEGAVVVPRRLTTNRKENR